MGTCHSLGCGCRDKREVYLQQNACRTFLSMPSTNTATNKRIPSNILEDPLNGCNVKTCQYITKVIIALQYYHSIGIIKNQMEFMQFIHTKCDGLIEYYHHISFVHCHYHSNDIQSIHNLLFNEYNFAACNLKKCSMAHRNLRDRSEEDVNYDLDNDVENSIELTFWIDFFDSIHCHLLHLSDYGYCMNAQLDADDSKEGWQGKKDPNDTFKYDSFESIKQYILQKKKDLKKINAHRANIRKFDILISPNAIDQSSAKNSYRFLNGDILSNIVSLFCH